MHVRYQTRFTVSGSIVDYITDTAEGTPVEVSKYGQGSLRLVYSFSNSVVQILMSFSAVECDDIFWSNEALKGVQK